MRKMIKKSIKYILRSTGYELVKISDRNIGSGDNYQHSMPTCFERVVHAKHLGFRPKCIVDAGAYKGLWTAEMGHIFSDARFIVIEPNPHLQSIISANLSEYKDRITMVEKAVSDESARLPFNIWGDPNTATGASLQNHVRGAADNILSVDVDTLDNILRTCKEKPDLVKMDLQGAEMKALRGATGILKNSEMFIIEFGCLEAYIDRATPRQLLDMFYDNDYCLYDIVDCHYRPYDGAMTGGDFFFVKNWSDLRKYKGWD